MSDLFSSWRTAVSSGYGQGVSVSLSSLNGGIAPSQEVVSSVDYEKIVELIDRSLSTLKVYVVESEITSAQNSIKAIVDQSRF